MGSLLSTKKQPSRITRQDEIVLELKGQRDRVKQYQRRIEANLDRERIIAKELIQKGQKDKALTLLKKKRYREKIIEQAMGQLAQLDQMVHDIEFAQLESNIMDSLKQGNESLKQMHRLMSVDDVEKILAETRESVEYQHEIDSLISGELNDTDVADVEAELDALLEEQAQLDLPEVPTDKLPDKPTQVAEPAAEISGRRKSKPQSRRKERDAELVSA